MCISPRKYAFFWKNLPQRDRRHCLWSTTTDSPTLGPETVVYYYMCSFSTIKSTECNLIVILYYPLPVTGGGNQAHSGLLAKANTENYEELFWVLLKNVEICRRNSESCLSHVLPGIRKVNTKPLREPLVTQEPWKLAI